MNEIQHILQQYFNFQNQDSLIHFSSKFNIEHFSKGDFILKESNSCQKIYFVTSGYLRMFTYADKKEITQWISCKGYFTTDIQSFILNTPSRWNIQALEKATTYSISKNDYQNLSTEIPEWNQIEKGFILRCFIFIENRIYNHLSMRSEEGYLHFHEHHKELFQNVPLQYLASMLGMTPETFSRIRNKISK